MAEEDEKSRRSVEILQSMIDISADRLVGLRTQCSTSAELTQREIRTLEGKLIKLFARQLVIKCKLKDKLSDSIRNIPCLELWLQVVGLCTDSVQMICSKVKSIEALLEKPQRKLKNMLCSCTQHEEEFRRLSTALKNLKYYKDLLLENSEEANNVQSLHWDSWDWQNTLHSIAPETSVSAVIGPPSTPTHAPPFTTVTQDTVAHYNGHVGGESNVDSLSSNANIDSSVFSTTSSTSSTPPLLSPPMTPHHISKVSEVYDHELKEENCNHSEKYVIASDGFLTSPPISKTRSHESQLCYLTAGCAVVSPGPLKTYPSSSSESKIDCAFRNGVGCTVEPVPRRSRLSTVPGIEHSSSPPSSTMYPSPSRSPPFIPTSLSPCHRNTDVSTTSPNLVISNERSPRKRISSEVTEHQPSKNIEYSSPSMGPVPRSPRTPNLTSLVMAHDIAHIFVKNFTIKRPCDYCCKPIIMNTGLKCKECHFRCHRECESNVPNSCGLPGPFVDEFKRIFDLDSRFGGSSSAGTQNESEIRFECSPTFDTKLMGSCSSSTSSHHPSASSSVHSSPGYATPRLSNIERRGGTEPTGTCSSASNSHSSAPSSPAPFSTSTVTITDTTLHTLNNAPATASIILSKKQQFNFSPEAISRRESNSSSILQSVSNEKLTAEQPTEEEEKEKALLEKEESVETTSSLEKSVNRDDSQDSQTWESDSVDKAWPRQYSVSMKEWEIPWDELKMGDKLGSGHFGTVYSGYWHGDVAVKVLNMEYLGDEKMLESFKSEVSTFRKTRHDNLVLFMGACMKPPRLAIVTSMVHGVTLYKYIHLRKDKFSMSKTTIIAQQISQGMGYLHGKGIVHKDLRTKNIFLEKERVIITDFGLFSVTKLCFKNRNQDGLIIPPGWLCYLAPEIMRSLRVHVRPDDEHLPFSKASDIYAFGTVWYELLCGDWPYGTQTPEAIIWQVGKGMKPSLANLEASRDVKDILMHCWSYGQNRRPDFVAMLKILDKLPKKRLARSPSHPVHLSRSAESMF